MKPVRCPDSRPARQPLDRRPVQPGRDRGIAFQRVGQRNLLGQRHVAGMLHDVMRLAAAEHRGQAHHHRLRHDQPVGDVEVRAHPLGIHHHPLGDRARVQQRAVRQHEGLGIASASACHGPVARSWSCAIAPSITGTSACTARAAARMYSRGDRVALLRHGRGRAAAGDIGFGDLPHLGLRQQDDVGGDLRQRAADQAEERHRLGQRVAADMPGRERRAAGPVPRPAPP